MENDLEVEFDLKHFTHKNQNTIFMPSISHHFVSNCRNVSWMTVPLVNLIRFAQYLFCGSSFDWFGIVIRVPDVVTSKGVRPQPWWNYYNIIDIDNDNPPQYLFS